MAVVVIVIFVAVQLAIPLSRIGIHESARRFGWQMFSTARETPSFVVIKESETAEIRLGDYMAGTRGDIDIVGVLPPHLCDVVPGALRITWESGEYEC